MKYAWIEAQRRAYPLPDMCDVLAVSISGYRAWRRGGKPDRSRLSDAQAVALMRGIHVEVKAAYGSRRMHRELQGRGHRIGLTRVERLTRENGIGSPQAAFQDHTGSKHSLAGGAELAHQRLYAGQTESGMGLLENCWDNAPSGSFFYSLNTVSSIGYSTPNPWRNTPRWLTLAVSPTPTFV